MNCGNKQICGDADSVLCNELCRHKTPPTGLIMTCPHCKILLEIVEESLLRFECDFKRPMTMPELIGHHGGPAAFSRLTKIPLRTVEEWKAGRRNPTPWLLPILTEWMIGK